MPQKPHDKPAEGTPPLGTLVEYRELIDQEEPTLVARTRTDVRWHYGHMVVWLEGKAGFVHWKHCRVVERPRKEATDGDQPT
jgi:hypothetical protein